MSDEQEPQQPGGRVVITGEAVVYKGGRRKTEPEPVQDNRDDETEEAR